MGRCGGFHCFAVPYTAGEYGSETTPRRFSARYSKSNDGISVVPNHFRIDLSIIGKLEPCRENEPLQRVMKVKIEHKTRK
jgi:hypothetical protein